jgi:hypothetical protein
MEVTAGLKEGVAGKADGGSGGRKEERGGIEGEVVALAAAVSSAAAEIQTEQVGLRSNPALIDGDNDRLVGETRRRRIRCE